MVNDSIFTYLLSDTKSLSQYDRGELVLFKKVKSNLFLLLRSQDTNLPDHYYTLLQEKEFIGIYNLSLLLSKGIESLAINHLRLDTDKVHVTEDKFSSWQKLVTYIPPLLIQSKFLRINIPGKLEAEAEFQTYYDKYLKNNFRYTAISHPKIAELEDFMSHTKGLHDLHIHLNGSAETDVVWQDFLEFPDKVFDNLEKEKLNIKVIEHFEQESHLVDPYKFYRLLVVAQKLRQLFYTFIFDYENSKLKEKTPSEIIASVTRTNIHGKDNQLYKHPFKKLLKIDNDNESELPIEALMYTLIFDALDKNVSKVLPSLFHYYLLIKGLANRLLVQQIHQYGFEQFQKHTINTLRDLSEQTYHERFFQMDGNEGRNLSFLEGRFSPKKTEAENTVLVNSILKGWNKFKKNKADTLSLPEFKLITHFIKKPENNKSKWVRHRELRIDINDRADVISGLIDKKPYSKLIVGIDAAANELHAPPEVFSPIFRRIRNKKHFKNFTYHVGEDFFHIISGLRAIYETINYLEFGEGDRLGHATATGICSKLWVKSVGELIIIHEGEWLDNLIFVRMLIISYGLKMEATVIENIDSAIIRSLNKIYDEGYSIDDYTASWKMRKYCPILAFSSNYNSARTTPVYNNFEWNEVKRNIRKESVAFKLYLAYHSKSIREKYNKPVEISSEEIFNADSIQKIQIKTLELVAKKNVIIETLPTSNVRISYYKDHSQHHIFNWIKWREDEKLMPSIVVGSDDTGIFATNIFNENVHIYIQALAKYGGDSVKAINLLKEIHSDSTTYKFER